MIIKRKYKVTNKKRFLLFITCILIVSFIAVPSLIFQNVAECEVEDTHINIFVKSGDTLWDIASKHNTSGKDLRELVQIIKKDNKLSTLLVFPGQSLKIPVNP